MGDLDNYVFRLSVDMQTGKKTYCLLFFFFCLFVCLITFDVPSRHRREQNKLGFFFVCLFVCLLVFVFVFVFFFFVFFWFFLFYRSASQGNHSGLQLVNPNV